MRQWEVFSSGLPSYLLSIYLLWVILFSGQDRLQDVETVPYPEYLILYNAEHVSWYYVLTLH
jgi:hypothetical protein